MMYGKYDLVCQSKSEYIDMHNYFRDNNINYIELYLDGITYNDIKNAVMFSSYNIYYSDVDTHRIYLLHK